MFLELCKGVHCVDLGESFQTHIYLQNLASIQPRTSPLKFAASREGAARLDAQGEVLTCGVSTDESRRFSGRVMILSGFRGFRSHFKIEIDVLQLHTISHDLLRPDRPLSRIRGLPALVQCGLSSRNSSATHDMSACGVRALQQERGCFAENLPLDGMAATCDWQDFPHGHVWACQQAWKEN